MKKSSTKRAEILSMKNVLYIQIQLKLNLKTKLKGAIKTLFPVDGNNVFIILLLRKKKTLKIIFVLEPFKYFQID
jgi:ribosomal protein L23